MQRFGCLKYLLSRASLSATNNIPNLAKNLESTINKKINVPLTPQLQRYIRAVLTGRAYKDLRTAAIKQNLEDEAVKKVQIELQHIYLADPHMPSVRGMLSSDDWHRYPYLALDLGLIRSGTFSLLVRGLSFLSLVSEEEKKAFPPPKDPILYGDVNPFVLTVPQKIILAFSLLENDGDILIKLYDRILHAFSGDFSDKVAGNFLPEIYRSVAKEARPRIRSANDRLRLQKLIDTADKIEAVQGSSTPGGKNPREHAITLRLELFVDVGLVSKPDPLDYSYCINGPKRIFFERFVKSESVESFLHNSFFQSVNDAFSINGKHQADGYAILSEIWKAYETLKSPLGYAPILELSLLAGIYSLSKSRLYFEISEAFSVLRNFQKEKPNVVRFNVNRQGVLTVVKFNENIMKHIGGNN